MRFKQIVLSSLFLLGFGVFGLRGQEAIPASGGNSTGVNGSVSYTAGQLVYITKTDVTGSVAQGVQQPYEISVITGNMEIKGISLNCSVYPNPTDDLLQLTVDSELLDNLSCLLYDSNGKIIVNKNIISSQTTIEMGTLAAAAYFLKIIKTEHSASYEFRTFKIIKK